ncbi:MAG: aminoacyl-tRNA hydrolase [Sedimentisphaerales bacterium]|nr:aminoacyl-tRNA hydrolase [Sedimentisphaerales bacterium]
MRMIVGLGNPGRKYAQTRHNAGFKVIDMLSEAFGIEVGKRSFGGRLGKGGYAGQDVLLLKPWQYMNCSGRPVADAAGFYRIKLSDVLVVLDDMWLEPGQIRLRERGSAGGHNGLADIIEKLGTENFPRLRVGIGHAPADGAVDYVLGEPDEKEDELINDGLERAKEAAICWLEEGTGAAMTKFNRFEKEKNK